VVESSVGLGIVRSAVRRRGSYLAESWKGCGQKKAEADKNEKLSAWGSSREIGLRCHKSVLI